MNKCEQLFIDVIAHSIFNKPIPADTDIADLSDIDLSALFELAGQHSMSGTLFSEMQKLYPADILSSVYEKQTKELLSTYIISSQQDYAYNELSSALSKAGIDHLPLKGIFAKRLYPSPELRTMGDLDILVNLSGDDTRNINSLYELVDSAIFDLGYKKHCFYDNVHCFHKDNIHLEMHSNINSEFPHRLNPVADMTATLWDNSSVDKNDKFSYTLNPQYEFIFTLHHLLKHLSKFGCGVRTVLDMAVLSNHFKDELDFSAIRELIEKQNLTIPCAYLFSLIEKWFGISCPLANTNVVKVTGETIGEFEMYILQHGTFGFIDRNTYSIIFRNDKRHGKLRSWFQLIFPSAETLSQKYPVLKKNKLFLPFYWIIRILDLITSRKKPFVGLFRKIASAQKPAKAESEFLKKIGL